MTQITWLIFSCGELSCDSSHMKCIFWGKIMRCVFIFWFFTFKNLKYSSSSIVSVVAIYLFIFSWSLLLHEIGPQNLIGAIRCLTANFSCEGAFPMSISEKVSSLCGRGCRNPKTWRDGARVAFLEQFVRRGKWWLMDIFLMKEAFRVVLPLVGDLLNLLVLIYTII